MKDHRFHLIRIEALVNTFLACLMVVAITIPLLLFGRRMLGEAVIALVYLVPVAWSARRWGQAPGLGAALTAALVFDYFFIPPFNTLSIGSLEGWLVLAIFLGVASVVVGRINASLMEARETIFMYELSNALVGLLTQDAVAHAVARFIQQLFQASRVVVSYRPNGTSPSITVTEMHGDKAKGTPDRIIPVMNSWGLIGEIHIWKGEITELPSEDSKLLKNFGSQTGRALERTRIIEGGKAAINLNQSSSF